MMDIACPPLPIRTPSASILYGALREHPLMKPIVKLTDEIINSAELTWDLDEVDGHYGNDRLHAFITTERLPKKVMHEILLCGNHSDHIITTTTLKKMDIGIINAMYAASNFVNDHWGRLVLAADLVSDQIQFRLEEPPVEAAAYTLQFCEFFKRNLYLSTCERHADSGEDDLQVVYKQYHRTKLASVDVDSKEFAEVRNNCWWDPIDIHWCRRPSCCPKGALSLRQRAREINRKILFGTKVQPPPGE
jgi:hypothetical protein